MKPFIKNVFFLVLASVFFWMCSSDAAQFAAKQVKQDYRPVTHKEAMDTLRANATAPVEPVDVMTLSAADKTDLFRKTDFSDVFVNEYPDNGFFGTDRYRIEVIFSEMKKDAADPTLYHVKGKNRHKKIITPFEGEIKFADIAKLNDPNLDVQELEDMEVSVSKIFALAGTYTFREDPTSAYSGVFAGDLQADFVINDDNSLDLWYYSQSDIKGCGYKFDGTWVSNKNGKSKAALWAADLFAIGNDILKDFSYGERDVEINPKYRDLGWAEWWSGEEWWNEATAAKK